MADPLANSQFPLAGVQEAAAALPFDKTRLSLAKTEKTVARLEGGKVASICNISRELLRQ